MAIICVFFEIMTSTKSSVSVLWLHQKELNMKNSWQPSYHKALELIGRLLSFFAGCKVNEINTFWIWIVDFGIRLRAILIYMAHWPLSNNFRTFFKLERTIFSVCLVKLKYICPCISKLLIAYTSVCSYEKINWT